MATERYGAWKITTNHGKEAASRAGRRDCLQYREIQKLITRAVKSVDRRIKVLGASSIMNTEDKLYSDGSNNMDPYIDVFTDHYVVPRGCYGPMIARARGKKSMETETWFVGTEYQLPRTQRSFWLPVKTPCHRGTLGCCSRRFPAEMTKRLSPAPSWPERQRSTTL